LWAKPFSEALYFQHELLLEVLVAWARMVAWANTGAIVLTSAMMQRVVAKRIEVFIFGLPDPEVMLLKASSKSEKG
jgi:hypothetical protein